MENTLTVAKEFYNEYLKQYHTKMDEMKMHKLMYFVQKESLLEKKDVLFSEDFYGWRYGPVLKSVRSEYMNNTTPFVSVEEEASADTKRLVKFVLNKYGATSSWRLSSLSHDEFSWKCARKNLSASDNGDVKLEVSAMKVDAARELSLRRNNLNY